MKKISFLLITLLAIVFTISSCSASRSSARNGGCFQTKGMVGYH